MRWVTVAIAVVMMATSVAAAEIDQLQNLQQAQFRALSEDLGAALSYKPLVPAEPLGAAGFDLGVEVSVTDLQAADALEQATSEDVPAALPIARLHVHKGLPFGFDVGASYSAVPEVDVRLWGVELRYAIVKGGTALPALALRGSLTRLTGVEQLDIDTRALDLSISKGFAFLTPYAGVGRVWVTSTPKNLPTTAPSEEDFGLNKYFAGLNVALGIFSVAGEADRTGDAWTYSAKLALRF
ncbi:MAG TPA: hypothetical protein VNM24_00725 [Burkholderiales bacterium]|jgi:hypothetical protein|nr:hypothetical protein [Burkholderiales bacterium]